MKSNARPSAKQPVRFAREQRGYALLLVVVGLVIGSLAYLTSNLNANSVRQSRDEITQQALAQAKEALIGWSVTASQGPGHFPCPDRDNDGDSEGAACGTPATRIGRLPWKTLGLPNLKDGYGESLWYAVSSNFINQDGNSVNSDTTGQLSVSAASGALLSNHAIAIVFSPGIALAGQTRNGMDVGFNLPKTTVSNYLEGANADKDPADQFAIPAENSSSNDRLLMIREEDLFPHVENEVARRLGPMLRYYYDQWKLAAGKGFFPYAAPADPSQTKDNFCVVFPPVNQPGEGLLPVSEANGCKISWSGSVVDSYGRITNADCANQIPHPKADPPVPPEPDADRMAALICTFDYSANATPTAFSIKAIAQNTAKTLALPVQLSDIKYGELDEETPYSDPNLGALISQSFSGSDLQVTYYGGLPLIAGSARIVIPIYSLRTRHPLHAEWFFDNDWFRLTYYEAVSQQLLNGSGKCFPGADCLTVNGLPGPGASNDKEVVLVLAGRALAGQTRPSANLNDYWEGQNASTGDKQFELSLITPLFNDHISVVSPTP